MKERVLVCDHSELLNCQGIVVNSPVRCLELAIEDTFDAVAVNFHAVKPCSRYVYYDLCAALGQRGLRVVAIMDIPHREMMERLAEAHVDYLFTIPQLVNGSIDVVIPPLEKLTELRTALHACCANIDYIEENLNEGMFCAVTNDRLLLTRQRILELCSTGKHTTCDYYLRMEPDASC